MNKAVRFGSISVREYDVVAGDNPSCSCGPPVSLDWSYCEAVNDLQVDEYERCRPERRTQTALSLSASARWIMLLDKHSPIELDRIVQEIERLQRASFNSANEPAQEWMEACNVQKKPCKQPKLKNFFTFIGKGKSTFRKLRRRTSSENSIASTVSIEADELLEDSLEDSRDYSSQVDDYETSEREEIRDEDEPFAFVQLEL